MSDDILTPAHLLVLPLDNQKLFNFLDFNDIGSNTLKESMAFKKVRTISKTFNTNLITVALFFVLSWSTDLLHNHSVSWFLYFAYFTYLKAE